MSLLKILVVILLGVSSVQADTFTPEQIQQALKQSFAEKTLGKFSMNDMEKAIRALDKLDKKPMVKRFIRKSPYSIDTWEGHLVRSVRNKGLITFYSCDPNGTAIEETFSRRTGREISARTLQLDKDGAPLFYSQRGAIAPVMGIHLKNIKNPAHPEAQMLVNKAAQFFAQFTGILKNYRGRFPISAR